MKSKHECYSKAQLIMNHCPIFYPENEILRRERCSLDSDGIYKVPLSDFYLQAFLLNGNFLRWNWRPSFYSKFKYLMCYHIKDQKPPSGGFDYWQRGNGQKNDPWRGFIL